MVMTLYKVTMINELVKMEPPRLGGNTGLGSQEALTTKFLRTNQYVTLFYMCFCVKTPTVVYIIDSLTLGS